MNADGREVARGWWAGLSRLQWYTNDAGSVSFGVRDAAFQAVVGALGDKADEVRLAAVRGLLELGRQPEPLHAEARTEALAGVLHDRSSAVRREAWRGFDKTNVRFAQAALQEGMRDPDPEVRETARRLMGELK